jgi:hypothetical protein
MEVSILVLMDYLFGLQTIDYLLGVLEPTTNKVRGLTNVASYTLFSILCLILNREADPKHQKT